MLSSANPKVNKLKRYYAITNVEWALFNDEEKELTSAYKQFGNSVVVPLMTEVANLVIHKLVELESIDEGKW